MKLSTRDAAGIIAKPPAGALGLLLYGGDGMRVALKRQEYLRALLGPTAEEEMRLTRIPAAELRQDPAMLLDAVKAVGFFPGARAVLVEDVTDQMSDKVLAALDDWQDGDAQIVVTAGALKPTSKLRKAYEAHANAYALGIYDDPLDRAEIERLLREAALSANGDTMAALEDLARSLDPGDFRQTVEKLSLYKLNDPTELSLDDIAACAPASLEAAVDDVLNVVADMRAREIGPVMRRLESQGVTAVTLSIQAMRLFRQLHRTACNPGVQVWGFPDRERIKRQARNWGAAKLEAALGMLTDTDLSLRSAGRTAPDMAMMERTFIRMAMYGAS